MSRPSSGIGGFASMIGRGLLAGFVGTVAITAFQAAEMAIQKRPPSSAPADAAGKVLGVTPKDDQSKEKFSNAVHWGYGTAWGAVRGLLDAVGVKGPTATFAHMVLITGAAMIMLPALEVAPPVSEWKAQEIALDAARHLAYAAAAGLAYDNL